MSEQARRIADRIVANERRQRPDMTDEEAKALHDRVTAPWHPERKRRRVDGDAR